MSMEPTGNPMVKALTGAQQNIGTQAAEVIVHIASDQDAVVASSSKENLNTTTTNDSSQVSGSSFSLRNGGSNLGRLEVDNPQSNIQMSFMDHPSPEIKRSTTILEKSPKLPTVSESAFLKPKSRFYEPPAPASAVLSAGKKPTLMQEQPQASPLRKSPQASPLRKSLISRVISTTTTPKENNIETAPITPKTPLIASPAPEEEDEEVFKIEKMPTAKETCCKNFKFWRFIEWVLLISILATLTASRTVQRLKHFKIWELDFWKWCLLVLVIICGRLFTEWFMNFLVFLFERNYLAKKKVLYFVYGLRKSVQVTIWLALNLLAWVLMFNDEVKRTRKTRRNLHYVTRALIAFLVGAAIWMVKTFLLKCLASSFHVTTFFDRIQESFFHQYVLQTLSGPPQMELAENIGSAKSTGQLSFKSFKQGKEGEKQEVIDVNRLHKLKQEKVSAWTMTGLSNVIRNTKLTTISSSIDESDDDEGEQKDKEITCEWEAKAAAFRIFNNVAQPGRKYIYPDDLQRFLDKEEMDNVLPLFEGAVESGKIKKSSLRNWVVKVYLERKSLALSLNDTNTAVKQLNKLVSVLVSGVILIVWLLIMGIADTKLLVFISSQMLLVVFVFGNTAKTIFEGVIFIFAVHPFDVGDRCMIDGVQMIVEEMNLLTTVFLRYDNQKMYFPNALLATKCIGNIYRSPFMGDSVEFAIDVATTVDTVAALKARIKTYIESKPQHWSPNHSVVVLEIEDVNKMKMALYLGHTMNHQNMGEKTNRRSELVFELKKIFEELSIKYRLLPREVIVRSAGSAITAPVIIG